MQNVFKQISAALILLSALSHPAWAATDITSHYVQSTPFRAFDGKDIHALQSNDGITLQWHDSTGKPQEWHITVNASGTDEAEQCEMAPACSDKQDFPQSICYGYCYLLPPDLVLADVSNNNALLSVTLGTSSNNNYILYSANLSKHTLSRLFSSYGSGLGQALLSADGHYLAYTEGVHGGWCNSYAYSRIFDLKNHKFIDVAELAKAQAYNSQRQKPYASSPLLSIIPARWISNTVLEVKEETVTCGQEPRKNSNTIVSAMKQITLPAK